MSKGVVRHPAYRAGVSVNRRRQAVLALAAAVEAKESYAVEVSSALQTMRTEQGNAISADGP